MVVEILEGDALVMGDDEVDVGEDVGEVALAGLCQFVAQFLDGLGTVGGGLVGSVGLCGL